jgi:ABC-type Zn uptake system ZnuABC Zn-binding protein ZnuA
LIQADPGGKTIYTQNAEAYIASLRDLDGWIQRQVEQIPAERRRLVTNHESFGYFADRYGFKVVGTVLPSVSTGVAPSAEQMAALIETVRASGARAIFLETAL